uniref:Uncharacterized protein n=1 Tax=Rhizophora mucronata TaxID=61149 RepID=A0A2P2N6K9_RHIMU
MHTEAILLPIPSHTINEVFT